MRPSDPVPDDVDSPSRFEQELSDLIGNAVENDVDVRGGWAVDGDGVGVEYAIEIYVVERPGG